MDLDPNEPWTPNLGTAYRPKVERNRQSKPRPNNICVKKRKQRKPTSTPRKVVKPAKRQPVQKTSRNRKNRSRSTRSRVSSRQRRSKRKQNGRKSKNNNATPDDCDLFSGYFGDAQEKKCREKNEKAMMHNIVGQLADIYQMLEDQTPATPKARPTTSSENCTSSCISYVAGILHDLFPFLILFFIGIATVTTSTWSLFFFMIATCIIFSNRNETHGVGGVFCRYLNYLSNLVANDE
ncbi:hypothetical protein SNEBB_004449 [Seison nebaliae]|nr:hypothetical protein SNEBB_004449 [Seison nebaliae]